MRVSEEGGDRKIVRKTLLGGGVLERKQVDIYINTRK